MFSFKKGRPIAKFTEGPYKGKMTLNIIDNIDKLGPGELGNDIHIKGKMLPIPNIEKREIVYIAGPSGAGKSTLAGNYLETFKKAFPKLPIYVFSRKSSDPALDKVKPKYFPINEDLIENPIDITKDVEKGACVVFDDFSTIIDDKIRKEVSKLMHDIMEVGRSFNVYCIITSHLINPNEKKDGRIIFNEADNISIFPKSGNRHAMNYALTKYLGFSKQQIDRILNLPSRWVLISTKYPIYILHERGAFTF